MLKPYIFKNKSDEYSAFLVYRLIYITVRYTHVSASQASLVVKNPPTNARDAKVTVLISGLGRSSGVGNGQLTPVFLPGKFHRQRILAGYSPRACKELDMTERLSTHRHTYATNSSFVFFPVKTI